MNRYKLSNGITVIEDPIEGSQSFTLMVMFRTGSRNETPEIWGISHFLEHMAFKGTRSYPNASILLKELDSLGAIYNAMTSKEQTGYYIKGGKKVFEKALSIIAEMTTEPIISDEEVDKERGTIIEELNMYEDDPRRMLFDYFEECLYTNKQISQNIIGTKESLAGIHEKQIRDYRDKYYLAGNLVISISGYIPENSKQLFEEKFSALKSEKIDYLPSITESRKQINLSYKDTQQTHLAIGFPGVSFVEEEKSVAKVLSVILGGNMSSRMFSEVREKRGLAYYVFTASDNMQDDGFVATFAGVNNEKAFEAVEIINNVYKGILTDLPADELTRTKDYIIGMVTLAYEDSEKRAENNAASESYGVAPKTLEEIIKEIELVTAEQVIDMAKRLFDEKKLCLALIGPFKDDKEFAKILKLNN